MSVSYTLAQAAEELRCPVDTVVTLIRAGELTAHPVPVDGGDRNEWRILRIDLEDFIARDCPGLAAILKRSLSPEPAAAPSP